MIPARMEERISAAEFNPDPFRVGDLRRHEGRYSWWEAEVLYEGETYSVDNRYGSWIVRFPDRMKEPEAVFGGETGRRLKFVLVQKILPLERAIKGAAS